MRSCFGRLRGSLLLVASMLLSASCRDRDDVRVRITHRARAAEPPIENVVVFVGGSKSSWPQLSSGESVSVTLSPEGQPPTVSMNFTLAGQDHTWRGPPIAVGVGYAIAIEIDAYGRIQERHCIAPCPLP